MARARSPSTAIGLKTPQEVWFGKPSDYSHVRIFGCPAYAHVNDKGKSPDKFLISRDVTFDESAMLEQSRGCESFTGTKDCGADQKVVFDTPDIFVIKEEQQEKNNTDQPKQPEQSEPQVEPVEEEADNTGSGVEDSKTVKKGKRNAPKPAWYAGCVNTYDIDSVAYALAIGDDIGSDDPKTYKEVVASKDGVKPVGCKWFFKRKEGIPGVEPARFNARLVAKGFSQKQGIDYHEVFSPVVKHKTIRVLLAMVGAFDLELEQLDVKTAFLHGNLEERIYMSQLEGFDNSRRDHLYLLKKSLFGLKQSPRQWYKRFDSFMVSNGYIRNQFDNCVYSKKVFGDSYVYLLLYGDDMLIAAKNMVVINDLKAFLKSGFEMKDLSAAKKILGMEIWRDRKAGRFWVSQEKYIEKVLQAFFVDQSKPVSTALAAHFKLDRSTIPGTDKEVKYMKTVPFSCTVQSLMYAMVCTRPNLAHAVSVVSRFMANPGKAHWKAVKWILRYLKGASNICLVYDGKGHGDGLVGYSDSDYGGDLVKQRSLTCFIFTLFGCAEVKSLRGIWCWKETTKRDTEEPLAVGEIPSQGQEGSCDM
ncbi:retrovirus-related pol polyprotein from transposon TNT 1-94, partial [Tanacetum coccineum]